jgi:hypothetical protein
MDPSRKIYPTSLPNAGVEKKNPQVQENPSATKPPADKKNTAAAVRNKMKLRNKSAEWRKACGELSTKLADELSSKPQKPKQHEIDEIDAFIAGVPEPYQHQLTIDALVFAESGESIPLINQLNWVEKQPTVKKAVVREPENSAAEEKTAKLIQKDTATLNNELDRFMSPFRPPVEDE